MDESSLIAAARQGDVPAFNRLVIAYQGLAYNVAYRILGDTDAAADATQEAFLSAYQGAAGLSGRLVSRPGCMRIVTNACYDQLRARQRRPSTPLDDMAGEDDEGEPREFVNGAEGPENHALRHELGRLIQRGVLTLPPDQRITLVLSDVQGLSYEEIAEATDANVGTVKSRLSRARARLRDYLLAEQELLPARYRLRDG